MTVYAYDTEFLEDGRTIDLISIGIIADDGREYYAISSEFDQETVRRHPFLRDNVWKQLPLTGPQIGALGAPIGQLPPDGELLQIMQLNEHHPEVKSRKVIAQEVKDFLLAGQTPPDLWAYFCSYDHVVLAQLFGPMSALPEGIPMWTHDLNHLAEFFGVAEWPAQVQGQHNALEDARWVMGCMNALRNSVQDMQRAATQQAQQQATGFRPVTEEEFRRMRNNGQLP